MTTKPIPRWTLWMAVIAIVSGVTVRVPSLIDENVGPSWKQVQAADKIAGQHWSHMEGRQTERACESIAVVNHGMKAGLR